MAAWTKTDYDNAYSFRVERYLGGRPPGTIEVRINYHEKFIGPIMIERWRNMVRVLTPAMTSADFVIIIGAGFGWGIRALRNRIGCACVGTDTSPYIQAEKATDDTAEIRTKILAVGLDPDVGRGLQILTFARTPGNRAKEAVLDEDMVLAVSRQRVRDALGGAPTWIIVEDVVDDDMSDAEITTLVNTIDGSSARKVWLYTVRPGRSAQALATLTGHRVITTGTFELVTP